MTGEAGSGKSRLLWEFFKYIDGIEEVRWWHQGRCLSYGEGVAYWALAEMVRARAGIVEEEESGDGAGEARGRRSSEFVTDERERRLVEPRLAQLLGLEQRAAPRRADLFSGWRLFFERMAAAEPVILAFEDLQWADSGLLDFIDYLLEWSADYPIFILALGRPELEERRPGWGTAIRLGPLAPRSDAGAARRAWSRACPASCRPHPGARGGVPLYAVETVRMLLDRGVLAQEGSRYVVAGAIEDLEVPENASGARRRPTGQPRARPSVAAAGCRGARDLVRRRGALAAVSERREAEVRRTLERSWPSRSSAATMTSARPSGPVPLPPGAAAHDRARARCPAATARRAIWPPPATCGSLGRGSPEIAEVLASHYLDAVAAEPDAADAASIRGRARETLGGGRPSSRVTGSGGGGAGASSSGRPTRRRTSTERARCWPRLASADGAHRIREAAAGLLGEAITAAGCRRRERGGRR